MRKVINEYTRAFKQIAKGFEEFKKEPSFEPLWDIGLNLSYLESRAKDQGHYTLFSPIFESLKEKLDEADVNLNRHNGEEYGVMGRPRTLEATA